VDSERNNFYNVEFTLKFNEVLKSLVVVANPKDEQDFLKLCTTVYRDHYSEGGELLIYFFRTNECARKFTYLRIVEDVNELSAVNETQCIGRLSKNLFTIYKDPPRIMKISF